MLIILVAIRPIILLIQSLIDVFCGRTTRKVLVILKIDKFLIINLLFRDRLERAARSFLNNGVKHPLIDMINHNIWHLYIFALGLSYI